MQFPRSWQDPFSTRASPSVHDECPQSQHCFIQKGHIFVKNYYTICKIGSNSFSMKQTPFLSSEATTVSNERGLFQVSHYMPPNFRHRPSPLSYYSQIHPRCPLPHQHPPWNHGTLLNLPYLSTQYPSPLSLLPCSIMPSLVPLPPRLSRPSTLLDYLTG